MVEIIYIDDDIQITKLVKQYLEMSSYRVTVAHSYQELEEIDISCFDLMLLDVMLPIINGIDICKRIRDSVSYPIIFISALGLEEDIICGLESGGDDYITKPFSMKQLKVKIDSHLRRENRNNVPKKTICTQNVILDKAKKQVIVNDIVVIFPKKEYLVIEKLMSNIGNVISKDQIFETIWGYDSESSLSTVTEHIKKIRSKLAEYDANFTYIQTKYGLGYVWEPKYEK
ncbi:nisin biosynthesis regulatory protein NisR [Enterococcus sp. 10A9_DIV0425]|uniref:Nisin biosynthesis regulatory protein NisR n=1 Tax=Candidatus Enterococcus wittei TaxID=1987383 RepID=A0A242JXY7_9ENTE|nr:response regulator transcription factor [Enterococcus sp. 10A9_DIV0425]OTP10184.1 nisin biosynthesis regulatory protein NisR [Enterococcus sp. 10A9_DIV0425]THE14627.1 response regulator transcription factor [Enterococcus hirae]